jgi:hypothetical protein
MATTSNVHRFDASAASGYQKDAQAPEQPELPDYLKPRVAADRPGRGVSEDTESSGFYPLLTVLQDASKGVNPRSPDYIAGAAPGNFLLRTRPASVRDGPTGIEVVVWFCDVVIKEWTADHSRVLAVHQQLPGDHHVDPKTGQLWRNGNLLINTRQLFLLHDNQSFELPLKNSGKSFFQDLTAHFRGCTNKQLRGMPSYVHRYKFWTKPTSNDKGAWFELKFTDLGWVSGEEYDRARALSEAFEADMNRRKAPPVEARRPISPE